MALTKDGLYKRIEFHLKWVIALLTLLVLLLAGLRDFFVEVAQFGDVLSLEEQHKKVKVQEGDSTKGEGALYSDDVEPVEMVDKTFNDLKEQIIILPNPDLELKFDTGKFEKLSISGVVETGYFGLRLKYSVKLHENEKILVYEFVNNTDLVIRILSLPVMCFENNIDSSSSAVSRDIENVFIPANGNAVGKIICSKGSTFSILTPP